MVSFLRQTKSEDSASYVLERQGQAVCTAESPFSFTNPRIDLFRGGGAWLRIAPNLGASVKGMLRNGLCRSVPCDIVDARGVKVGSIARARSSLRSSSSSCGCTGMSCARTRSALGGRG